MTVPHTSDGEECRLVTARMVQNNHGQQSGLATNANANYPSIALQQNEHAAPNQTALQSLSIPMYLVISYNLLV